MEQTNRVIALGFFDGVHNGHGALLRRATEVAARLGAVPAAVTFDTHPENLILHRPVPLITSPAERADLMERCYGVHQVIVAQFDQRMMHMSWEAFITNFLVGECGAVHLVAGHDFHFGYQGAGNPTRLQAKCKELGIGCDILGKVEQDGITVSSTYIRTLIAQGDLERASLFLGHPYTLTDTVAKGKHLGTFLGFPTVNLRFPEGVLVPAFGVYATRVFLPDGSCHAAVTNVGTRPTLADGEDVTVEGYLLDFSGDLYGAKLRMEFHRRLREERQFDSLSDLTREVLRNAEETRSYFHEAPNL